MSLIYTWESASVMTHTRTKQLQDFYGIKYDELWDEERLKTLWVKDAEIEEIKEIRGKEYAYKDTVGYEVGKWVLESERFKKIQEFYWITIEDIKSEETLAKKWVKADDIAFIKWKTLKLKAKKDEWGTTKWGTKSTTKSSKTTD